VKNFFDGQKSIPPTGISVGSSTGSGQLIAIAEGFRAVVVIQPVAVIHTFEVCCYFEER
jgi:hypothetical protein